MNGHAAVLPGKLATTKTKKKPAKGWSALGGKKLLISRVAIIKLGVAALILAVLFGGGFGYVKAYKGKIYPKIVVAGVKVGGMTVEDAKKAVSEKADELNEKGPEITYNDKTLKPKLDEMGVSFNVDEAVNLAYYYGRADSLLEKLKENYQILIHYHRIEITPQIDEQKFNDYLGQLAKVAEKEPVNANLVIHRGVITLTPSETGRGLDKEKLKEELKSFINSGENGQIVMVTSDLEPTILEKDTEDARGKAEKFMAAAPITVTFENSAWTADRGQIGSWIKFSASGGSAYGGSPKLVASADPSVFVNWIAKQVEIPAKDKEIEDGTSTVLNEGSDGRGVDKDTLENQIKDALASGSPNASFAIGTFIVARSEKTIYSHAQPGRYSGRYIDINLSEQTLYAFEGNTQVNSFLVSTGRPGYATPTGEFAIYGKDRYTLMHGPDYYLPNVPFVSWFYADYSIHGTYWHHNFGHTMSHGCVNASTPDAEWLFGWDDIGTPVYIHY